MNPAGPVLRDIHLPAAAWWPVAPTWWGVLALVLVAVAATFLWFVIHHRQRALRAVLREIDQMQSVQQREPDASKLATQASELMRRVAKRIDPDAASADGAAWRSFLQRYARTPTVHAALQHLLDERYRQSPALDAATLLPALRLWCRAALRRTKRVEAPHGQRASRRVRA